MTLQRWRRTRPIRVVIDIADRALRADIADACEDNGIAVAASAAQVADADVALIDRPVDTALPAVAFVPDETHRNWPANVRATVPTDVDAATLAAIITVVAAGFALASPPDPAGAGTDDWADPGNAADEPAIALSLREREVLALLAEGASNKEIANALALSISTVKFHVAAIMEKLGSRSRVDAVAIAIRSGLVMV